MVKNYELDLIRTLSKMSTFKVVCNLRVMRGMLLVFFVGCAGGVSAINTNNIGSGSTTVSAVYSYSEFGGGDVYFTINDPIAECSKGYWFRKTDPGFEANLSMLLAAYHASSTVVIYGLPDEPWSGTSPTACRLYAISYR